ncbi:serine hydrolase [Sphingomicrobium clamense]|uniref:Serine hydrolase n=1 Tax=Sphingomicrobium clamense TaxID=2851013 RepID=A0ABS6V8D4_9SPHN|nr:serine hydrolase [Sphingomicrobium sp. B8]MBW0145804.1 serine hydrolase [Sphingomicrobium sp. B8]
MRMMMGAMAMLAAATPAAAQQNERFARAVQAVEERLHAVDALGEYPGRALVMVKRGEAPIVDVIGSTRAEGGVAADGETPFYIASMTKAFVGLMAVRLDEMGVMPLDTTIGELFPEMKVEGIDFDALTMRDALTHQLGFRAPALNIRTAYTDLVPIKDYPAIVNAAGEANGEAFRYDNLGYLLYAAALEAKTGKSWRAWIDDVVFDPLGMTHTSARTSDFPEVSHSHEVRIDGPKTFAPKTDAIMHAAGGLVISADDMARWLLANAGDASAIPQDVIDKAQASQVPIEMSGGPMTCTGYAFGWRRCEAFGMTVLGHGGGYTGMRSQMLVLPEEGVGFAIMFNSDAMTGGLSEQMMETFLTVYADGEAELPTIDAFKKAYAERVQTLKERRQEYYDGVWDDERWGGWAWQPSVEALSAYSGRYTHPAAGTMVVSIGEGALTARLNGMAIETRPAKVDLFCATLATDPEPESMAFERAEDGRVTSVTYSGVGFTRVD